MKYLEELAKKASMSHDDKFNFRCLACGQCCTGRDYIMMSAYDLYRAAKYLHCEPNEFLTKYCEVVVGSQSKFPVLLLRMRGRHNTCPFLKDNRCSIHEAKPSVCRIFPLARVAAIDKNDGSANVRYIVQDIHCGSTDASVSVREWIGANDIEEDEMIYAKWSEMVGKLSELLMKLFEHVQNFHLPENAFEAAFAPVAGVMYCHYDLQQEFLPQLEKNGNDLLEVLTSYLKELGVEHE